MNRRNMLAAFALSWLARPAVGQHGWQPDRTSAPLYLEGAVTNLSWADPDAHLELLNRPVAALPARLLRLPIPRQKENVDTADLLRLAVVPPPRREVWRVELPTLARLTIWRVPRPKIEQVIGVLGYPGPPLDGTPTIRAELLFIGDNAYPLRSDPA